MRRPVVLGLVLASLLAIALLAVRCGRTEGVYVSLTPQSSAVASAPPKKPLPAEPPPPGAGWPDNEAINHGALDAAMADAAFISAWNPEHRADLDAMLTLISEYVVTMDTAGHGEVSSAVLQQVTHQAVVGGKLTEDHSPLGRAADQLIGFFARRGAWPVDFERRFRNHLAATRAEPNLGTWSAAADGRPIRDYSGLAFVFNRERPEYIRAFLAAKRSGPIHWNPRPNGLRPYLNSETSCLAWLGMVLEHLDPPMAPTAAEMARLRELLASKLGDGPTLDAPIGALLATYGANEVKGDGLYKGKVIATSGVVREVKRDLTNSIFVILGTGTSPLELPAVQCFFDDRFAQQVGKLDAGERIRIRGRVDGLMMNVLVKDCEIVD